MRLTRRQFLASTAALGVASLMPHARAQSPGKIIVASHKIHQTVSTGTQGGDITKAWTDRTGINVEWITFDVGPLKERLFREASLNETSIDVGFLLNTQLTPATANLFEDLGPYMQEEPLEAADDFFPGMMQANKINDKQIAVPFRHNTSGLHYNEVLFAERGVSRPPQTIEEFFEVAKKLTYTRDDGSQVAGLCIPGVNYANVVDIARGWDGDFITSDLKVVANHGGMLKAVLGLRELYEFGAFPRNFAALQNEDVNTWMQQGRAAMAITSMSRSKIYNDPEKSKFPGQMKVVPLPSSAELKDRLPVAPVKVEFWSMAIPRNARNKKVSWDFIREMTSKKSTLIAALNGNGPVRSSTYEAKELAQDLPYASAEQAVLQVARVPLPAFDEAQRAADIFKEEVEAAVLGLKPVQEALDEVTARVSELLKS